MARGASAPVRDALVGAPPREPPTLQRRLGVFSATAIIVGSMIGDPRDACAGVALVALGWPAYAVFARRARASGRTMS